MYPLWRPLEAVALGERSGGAGHHRVVSMHGFLAGGHEDLDAHTVGGAWRRHVVRGDGEDDVFGDLGSQSGVELLLQLCISEARDVAACSDFDSAGPLMLMMTG